MNNVFYIMGALSWSPGFFCSFQSVVGFLKFVEEQKPIGFKVFFEKGLYLDSTIGPNWWEYYFEPINIGKAKEDTEINHIGDMLKSQWSSEAISIIPREEASSLIQKHIKVKQLVQNKINVIKQKFENKNVIGIHYRGTDKSSEARRVSYNDVSNYIKTIFNSDDKIFVATDEQMFITHMVSVFGDSVIYTNAIRSNDNGKPIHHTDGRPMKFAYQLGEDAVIDCYLLANCNMLVKTFSNLSSSAANINPNIPIVNLNEHHASYSKHYKLR